MLTHTKPSADIATAQASPIPLVSLIDLPKRLKMERPPFEQTKASSINGYPSWAVHLIAPDKLSLRTKDSDIVGRVPGDMKITIRTKGQGHWTLEGSLS